MSLTAALERSTISLSSRSFKPGLTHGDGSRPFHQESSYINLNRMLVRYQHLILLTPDSSTEGDEDLTPLQQQTQADLWSPLPYQRTKWLHNIDGARGLLLQLERTAQNIRVQRAKQNALKDLAEKRMIIKRLKNKVEEIGREVEVMGEEAFNLPPANEGRESAMDIIRSRRKDDAAHEREEKLLEEGKPVHYVEEEAGDDSEATPRDQLFSTSSSIRRRGQQQPSERTDEGQSTSYSGLDAGERAMLDSSKTQEEITSSLVSMAAQLKQQARKFQFSLDQDKSLLDRALEGLDRNVSGLEAASKNMAFLKRMSEGEGLWGRLKLYAIIAGMWVAAILLVFVGPKLRF